MAETEEYPLSEFGCQLSIHESTLEIENEEMCGLLADFKEETCVEELKSPILYEFLLVKSITFLLLIRPLTASRH